MANVFDTARYILEQRGKMSTMKLQKLCYYAQAWHMVWTDTELFDEDFQAWVNGPVCYELYSVTKGKFSVIADDEPGNSSNLTDIEKESIDLVIASYGDKDAQWLSDLTHAEDPWRIARKGTPPGAHSENIITKESMGWYYSGIQE